MSISKLSGLTLLLLGCLPCLSAQVLNDQTLTSSYREYRQVPPGMMSTRLQRIGGSPVTLGDFKGKFVLVNTWATWCAACLADLPDIDQLRREFEHQGLQVIGVNIGDEDGRPESLKDIDRFSRRFGVVYPMLRADDMFVTAFFRFTRKEILPQSVLIDLDGNARAIFAGFGPSTTADRRRAIELAISESSVSKP